MRVRSFCAVVGLGLLLAGCNVTTRVDITMHDDGSGALRTTITLDADAVQQLGGASSFARNVPLDDVRKAGWAISPWAHGTGGAQTITLSRPFANQADLERRIIDLAGPHGILQSPTLTHRARLVQRARRGEHRRRRALTLGRHRA